MLVRSRKLRFSWKEFTIKTVSSDYKYKSRFSLNAGPVAATYNSGMVTKIERERRFFETLVENTLLLE
jgi:hypothetical protein